MREQKKPTKKWMARASVYRKFGKPDWDYSEEAAVAAFNLESSGYNPWPDRWGSWDNTLGDKKPINGFIAGKAIANLQLTTWQNDMPPKPEPTLFVFELFEEDCTEEMAKFLLDNLSKWRVESYLRCCREALNLQIKEPKDFHRCVLQRIRQL